MVLMLSIMEAIIIMFVMIFMIVMNSLFSPSLNRKLSIVSRVIALVIKEI